MSHDQKEQLCLETEAIYTVGQTKYLITPHFCEDGDTMINKLEHLMKKKTLDKDESHPL